MGETVLVTGGAGFIGSHTCKALIEQGFTPVIYDSLDRGHQLPAKFGELEIGDITDQASLEEVMQKHKPAAVLHFAGLAYVAESFESPEAYWFNNVGGTLSVLLAMQKRGVHKLIYSSSCATYGFPDSTPPRGIEESNSQNPISPYGLSKLAAEMVIRDFESVDSVILRYFNAAGADPDGELGEDHIPEPHIIPQALMAAELGIEVAVNGDDYVTKDGTCVRDYVHVTDLAEAHVKALIMLQHVNGCHAFNLGSGNGTSILEILAEVKRVTGKQVNYHVMPRRPGDAPELVASNQKAKSALSWEPKYSDLETIIRTAWAWLKREKK